MLRPAAAAAGRAIRRAAYHSDGGPPPRKLRGPRFSPLNRHNHEVDALLEEIKNTPVSMISDDLIIRTVRQYILVQNVLRSWAIAAAVLSGYCWGYNRVAKRPVAGSEPPTEDEAGQWGEAGEEVGAVAAAGVGGGCDGGEWRASASAAAATWEKGRASPHGRGGAEVVHGGERAGARPPVEEDLPRRRWCMPSAASDDATLGRHLACRLVQVGISDVFAVPGDLNLTLLDHLIAEPGLRVVDCCNELNTGYAANGYAWARGMGTCTVTFTVCGLLLHGRRHRSHWFWNQETGDEAGAAFRNQECAGAAPSLPSAVARRSGSVVVGGGRALPSSPSSETTAS
uniref:pyruvate decarboxylase n=1 Tax=Oryza barthii TaxID=65489 RepID=A0A0D3GLH0_9ORYZ